ncbi:MAG: hypothetical protein LJF30_13835 [Acidobacteria bacterium]|nr:hypothetical protein [Acidobacteriota bacterium]
MSAIRPPRRRLLALSRGIRSLLGTLVAVPVVVLLFGSHWSWDRSVAPRRVWKIAPDATRSDQGEEVSLHFYEDGSDPGRGVELGDGSVLRAELPREVSRFQVVLQVDPNDFYLVLGGPEEGALEPLWKVRRERSESVLTTLRSPRLEVTTPIRFLQVEGLRGEGARSVAGLRLDLEPLEIPHLVLVPLLWGAWLLLGAASRTGQARWATAVLDRWRRVDLWLAAVLIGAVVLETPSLVVYSLLAVAAIWAVLRLLAAWLAHAPASLLATAVVVGLLLLVVPRIFKSAITARLARFHDLTVDHRPRPGGEINADRIRFSGTASDLADEDFVVLFLGDSFTYGETLAYDEAYPYAFERIVSGFDCTAPIRSVDGGWVSSSPLLALRLLQEIGRDYRPDLVVYSLDMTDFHDDLLYEQRLREGGDLEIDAGEALVQGLVRAVPALASYVPRLREVRSLFRARDGDGKGGGESLPEDRFFATAQPLEESEADIERGVIRNLASLHDLSTETLGARMALVVYPRAYQYSTRESPASWERYRYEAMGPWVREPFRYFRENGNRLPYPVLDALPTFEGADEFPLFRDDDPHWNEAGARLMAETVARWAAESGLIPCHAPPE